MNREFDTKIMTMLFRIYADNRTKWDATIVGALLACLILCSVDLVGGYDMRLVTFTLAAIAIIMSSMIGLGFSGRVAYFGISHPRLKHSFPPPIISALFVASNTVVLISTIFCERDQIIHAIPCLSSLIVFIMSMLMYSPGGPNLFGKCCAPSRYELLEIAVIERILNEHSQ